MIRKSTHASHINKILNHPEVHPWVSGDSKDARDVTKNLEHPNFLGLEDEGGCFIVQQIQTGIYEFHTAVLPEYQGKWAAQFFEQGLDWMFTHTNAIELLTKVPRNNRAAKIACVHSGFEFAFETRPLYPVKDGMVCFDVYSMTIQKWAKLSNNMEDYGQWFHNSLEVQYIKLDRELKVHIEDKTHDRYVGMTVLMMMNGFPQKADSFYNRWALMSSYQPISVVSLEPLVIDIFESKLLITDNHFEVL